MNYVMSRVNVDATLAGMAWNAAKELEREGYVKVVKSRKGRKVYFKPTEINIEPLIFMYSDSIMKDLASSNTEVTSQNAKEIVSKYVTVETFKKDIKELQGRIED